MGTKRIIVSLTDPKTGEERKLPLGNIGVGISKTNGRKDGNYTFNAKLTYRLRVNRKTRKAIRRFFRPVRLPKYFDKATMAKYIIEHTRSGSYSYDELIRKTAKQLRPIFMLYFFNDVAYFMSNAHGQYTKRSYPSGGIVPGGGSPINKGEMVVVNPEDILNAVDETKPRKTINIGDPIPF